MSALVHSGEYSLFGFDGSRSPSPWSNASEGFVEEIAENDSELPSVVVWDFDKTITKIHTCNPPLSLKEIQSLSLEEIVADPVIFRKVIDHLINAGFHVSIASFGHKEIILDVTNRIFSGTVNPFNNENIVTPSETPIIWKDGHEPPPGHGKSDLMIMIQKRYQILENKKMILIDDSLTNCIEARNRNYRSKIVSEFGRWNGFTDLLEDVSSSVFLNLWRKFIQ